MFLKVMTSGDGCTFEIFSGVQRCAFREHDGDNVAAVVFANGTAETISLPGSAFILNESGATIERYVPKQKQEKQS